MSIKRIFIVISAIFAASAVFADNSSVTSKKYVDDLMSGYQGKLPGSGANTLMIYDNSEDGIGEKSIETTLVSNATGVPTVGAVKTGLDGKQDTITGTAGYVMTGTGTPGEVGERAIYGTAFYGDSLVTAENVNTGVTNAVNNSLIRVDENGNPSNTGTLWEINTDLFALGVLPAGYTQLEWIESDGTQAINTGVKYDGNDFVVEWTALDSSEGSMSTLFAAVGSSPYSGGLYGKKSSRRYYIGISDIDIGYVSNDNLFHNWKITVSSQDVTLTKDGVNGATKTFVGTVDTTHNIYLFCGGWVNATDERLSQFSSIKLTYWKLYKSGVLAFNGIPASKVENNETVVGLYDTVSGQFFPDAAGGNFTAGPPVGN